MSHRIGPWPPHTRRPRGTLVRHEHPFEVLGTIEFGMLAKNDAQKKFSGNSEPTEYNLYSCTSMVSSPNLSPKALSDNLQAYGVLPRPVFIVHTSMTKTMTVFRPGCGG